MTGCVDLDHGSGGTMSATLVRQVADWLGPAHVGAFEDSAILDGCSGPLAMTTDSFVVDPIFFRGGDIGKIAVCGTVNDIAMSGADARWLSFSLILEEGFSLAELERIVRSAGQTAIEASVQFVCGDTKVLPKGAIDKVAINTAGVGTFGQTPALKIERIATGDAVVVTSYVGDHGIQILSMREGLGYEDRVPSDCAPLNGLMRTLLHRFGTRIHCARDLTRGGLATALSEIAQARGLGIRFQESQVPTRRETLMACDMLGIDPYHLANEGCAAIFVAADVAIEVTALLRDLRYGGNASIIGEVNDAGDAGVVEVRRDGSLRQIRSLSGRVLPRLC